jgi:hypothetical protein
MKVNVKILMDKNPSGVNRKILDFLMTNVNDYKMYLSMSISTISSKQMDSLDSKIESLPAAYIGKNVVMGCEQIINNISSAYNNCKLRVDNSDPIQSFWDKNIKEGLGESTKKNPGDELSLRFTEVTKNRKEAINGRSGRFKGGKERAALNDSDEDDDNSKKFKHKEKKGSPAKKNTTSTDLQYDDDPGELETDPHMKMFWANQKHTPGCD